jgi:hypothetical protein
VHYNSLHAAFLILLHFYAMQDQFPASRSLALNEQSSAIYCYPQSTPAGPSLPTATHPHTERPNDTAHAAGKLEAEHAVLHRGTEMPHQKPFAAAKVRIALCTLSTQPEHVCVHRQDPFIQGQLQPALVLTQPHSAGATEGSSSFKKQSSTLHKAFVAPQPLHENCHVDSSSLNARR